MSRHQPGILAPLPPVARFLEFRGLPDADPRPALRALGREPLGDAMVVGLGAPLIAGLGKAVSGLKSFSAHGGPGVFVPATQDDLWIWLRGDDRGDLVHRSRALTALLGDAFTSVPPVDAFQYRGGLDLTGYEDGTENPRDAEAVATAIAEDGSSFLAAQQWVHDLDHFESLPGAERDAVIGRRIADNEEIDDAPASAHVKRAAQESFDPQAFLVRRSMPWADGDGEGLMFLAFGRSLDAFEAILHRMIGAEDGVTDALFRFSRPQTGGYYWCPPVRDGHLDLRSIGL